MTSGVLCFHERLAVDVADRIAAALYQEGNGLFLSRFYYDEGDND